MESVRRRKHKKLATWDEIASVEDVSPVISSLDNAEELSQIQQTPTNCFYILQLDEIVYLGLGCKT